MGKAFAERCFVLVGKAAPKNHLQALFRRGASQEIAL
jgi:hypothetical protein